MLHCKMEKSAVMKKPGDFIGLELLSSKGIYIATLTALTSCEIAVIPRDAFLTFIQEDSPAAEMFMQSWSRHHTLMYPFITEQNLPDEDYTINMEANVYGLNAINAHNGWAISVVGVTIVFTVW